MFKHVVFEISGKCNALCKWCFTGRKNKNNEILECNFLNIEKFKEAVKYLKEKKFISDKSVFFIYNWGEPFLNPKFKDFVNFFNKEKIEYVISTNASKFVKFDEENILRNLRAIVFSMPGFSQKSYDKIHGFNFNKIKENIYNILGNYREKGFRGKAEIRYHVYQFNINEIPEMIKFAKKNRICISPTYAGIADLEKLMSYLSNEMEYSELKELSQELIFPYVEETKRKMPKDYKCPYYDVLLIDENCDILTCCMVTKDLDDYSIGNLFSLEKKELLNLKYKQNICKKCMNLKIPYLINNRPYPVIMDNLDLNLNFYDSNRKIFLFGTTFMAFEVAKTLKEKGITISGFFDFETKNNKESLIEEDNLYKIEEILNTEKKPYVIIADEYIIEKEKILIENGYIYEKDYMFANIIRRNY